jgi:Cu(I)/Ag(I) efflux system membrane fusion protein
MGCGSNEETATNATETAAESKPAAPPQSKLGEAGTSKLMGVVADYYSLKDALVATDAVKADEAAKKLMASADSFKASGVSDSVDMLVRYMDSVSMGSKQILSLKDETTEKKRIHFEKVSDAVFGALRAAELKNGGVYRQYCPMAFNDKGAFWLSDVTDIKNPYFGKKMLECGEVTDSL